MVCISVRSWETSRLVASVRGPVVGMIWMRAASFPSAISMPPTSAMPLVAFSFFSTAVAVDWMVAGSSSSTRMTRGPFAPGPKASLIMS
jgi:hypothetical protein